MTLGDRPQKPHEPTATPQGPVPTPSTPSPSHPQAAGPSPTFPSVAPAAAPASDPALSRAQEVRILHTTDLHGQVQAMPYLATIIKQERAAHPDTLVLDSGDWAFGSQISDLFHGKPMIEIMNNIGYTAVGVGEGDLAWGLDRLLERASEAKFPFLAANLVSAKGHPLPAIKPHHVVQVGSTRVGIIGVCCPSCEREGQVKIVDPRAAILESMYTLRASDVRTFVVLSHLGLDEDRALAAAVPGIDCILGGHSHTTLATPEKVGDTVITASGQNAEFVQSLILWCGTAAEAKIRAGGQAPGHPAGNPRPNTGGTTP